MFFKSKKTPMCALVVRIIGYNSYSPNSSIDNPLLFASN